ncbi:MAG: metal ABC transporter permease [Planctomycetes bacterium]|nr:metal ABC transporter permease [Planctomycetota bacterium]
MQFFEELGNYTFLQHAVLASLLASIACGVMGSYVVVRRISYIAGAIAHCVLGGMGMARYLQVVHGMEFFTPLVGATLAAIIAAFIIGLATLYARQRSDTVLSVVWALGMAIGITFITRTPGYYQDLMSYLFGDILMVGRGDLWLIAGLDLVIVIATLLFYNKFLVISFNEELARLRGIKVGFYNLLLLELIALTVVLLVQVVGLVMVIALLALPAATAAQVTKNLWKMMLLAIILSVLFTIGGLAISYEPELPAGATVIELAGLVYLVIILAKWLWSRRAAKES